jgi:hypothetical protein
LAVIRCCDGEQSPQVLDELLLLTDTLRALTMNFRSNFHAEFTETFHLPANTTLKILVSELVAADAMVLFFL